MKVADSDEAAVVALSEREKAIRQRQQEEARLDAIGAAVGKKRDDAVSARRSSGIERTWREDEEYYLGIDDLNRHRHPFTKAAGLDGGLRTSEPVSEDEAGQCTAFFNITRPFVDAASSRMGDILLPANDWPFSIKPTPIADLEIIKDSSQPVVTPDGEPILKEDNSPYTLGEFAKEEQVEAERKVEKAENRIKDWLTECQFKTEMRRAMEDAAKLGTGIIRGPYPIKSKAKAFIDGAFVIEEKIVPGSKRISPWNFYPDPNCGDNIHNGDYCLEREFMTARQLRDLIGTPGYLTGQIQKVLKEGPNGHAHDGEKPYKDDDRFEVWYYYGFLSRDDLEICGCEFDDEEPDDIESIPAVVVLVNNTVIKAFLNPLTSGEFPYDVMVWQRVFDEWWGVGVARQGRVAQDMLNASARTLMNNAGLSSAPQVVYLDGVITPVDGDEKLVGGKLWVVREDADISDVRQAFTTFDIPSKQNELVALIQLAQKMMEDATGVVFLLQGQQGSAPDTVGGMELLHRNASSLLRRVSRIFDESVTEPHLRRYYDWLLLYGEDDEKGDLEIKATGSSALVEREIKSMQAAQILQMALNPAFGYSPKKAADELLRGWHFEPARFEMDEEEKQAMQSQQPIIPQIEVAKINAESRERIEQSRMQSTERKIAADMDRDEVYQEELRARTESQLQLQLQELALRRELAMMEYANKNELKLAEVKAQLAETAMKLNTTKELVGMKANADQLPKPPVEPPGRAPAGESFTQ